MARGSSSIYISVEDKFSILNAATKSGTNILNYHFIIEDTLYERMYAKILNICPQDQGPQRL